MDLDDLRRGLSAPEAYPDPPEAVGLVETHISLLFFTQDRVYKLKKPVDLGFVDYTTAERRRHFCEEEVRLNRRLAPDVMLGVVPVTLGPDGRPRMGRLDELDRVEAVDHAVLMLRLPADGMLSARLERGAIDNALLNDVADLLARFHAEAPTGAGVDEHGAPERVAANVADNFTALAEHVAPRGLAVLSPTLFRALRQAQEGFLAANDERFRARVRSGRIRDGHGDLHAENVCVTGGRVVAYDCIEFRAGFRCGDVAADLAFLAMDIDRRGFPGFSAYLVHRYAERAGDDELHALLDFYKTYRAVVRGKVAALTALGAGDDAARRERARNEASAYLRLAAGYGLPPHVVLVRGADEDDVRALARPLRAACLHAAPGRTLAEDLADALRLDRSAVVRLEGDLDEPGALRRTAAEASVPVVAAAYAGAAPSDIDLGPAGGEGALAAGRLLDALWERAGGGEQR